MSSRAADLRRGSLLALALSLAACGGGAGASERPTSAPPSELTLPEPSPTKPKASPLVREGESLLTAQDYKGARAKFEQAIASAPGDGRAQLGLGLALEGLGDPEGAEAAYQAAVKAEPTLAEAWNNLGLVLRDAGRDAEALDAISEAVKADPNLASAHANLALVLEDSGDIQGAAAAYQRSLELDGKQTLVRVNYGLLLLAENDQSGAARELRTAWKGAQGDPAALLAIGVGLRRAGEPAEAAQAVQQAIDAEDTPTPALLSELALAQHAAGDSAAAQASLRKALELAPRYAVAHYLIGGIAASSGDFAVAKEAYQAYLKLEPKGAMADKARERLKAVEAAQKSAKKK